MVKKKKSFKRFTVTVTQGTGSRISRGRFDTKSKAIKFKKKLLKSKRTDADTRNPRVKKFKGVF